MQIVHFDFLIQNSMLVNIPHYSKLSGGRLNKQDGLTRYGDSHVKD